MTLLIDTNVYLWYDSKDSRLSSRVFTEIENPSNTILVSVVSIWEIAILANLGRIKLKSTIDGAVKVMRTNYHFNILPLKNSHCNYYASLPRIANHKNPFDRIIISQAITEKIKLAANDQFIPNYPVDLFW